MKNKTKGFSHVDFVIAASLFILIFAAVLQTMTAFFENAESTAEVTTLTGKSLSLLSIADYGFTPENWNGTGNVSRLGLASVAYSFYVTVNNTRPFLRNQSQNVTDVTNELVTFNYTDIGYDIDVNSTNIYNDGNAVAYNIDGMMVTFLAGVSANESRTYRIFFDDDSNFTSRSVPVGGSERLTEVAYAPQALDIIQYRKIMLLNGSNYQQLAGYLNTGNFRINIYDLEAASIFIDYGGDAPTKGSIVALQRYVLFQNSTGGVRNGRLIVKSW